LSLHIVSCECPATIDALVLTSNSRTWFLNPVSDVFLSFHDRSFAVSGLTIWNSLPAALHVTRHVTVFINGWRHFWWQTTMPVCIWDHWTLLYWDLPNYGM